MYTPPSFAGPDQPSLHDFIESYSFATLLTNTGDGLAISHLPLLLDRHRGEHGSLFGHMAKANTHWKEADGQKTFAVFHGPHAYISPTWYESLNVVATWNYIAVHASGTFRLDDTRERRLEIVRHSSEFYERTMDSPWTLESQDKNYIDQLLDAIVGFRIDIDHVEGKWQLSQNQDESRRMKVAAALRKEGSDDQIDIANLIMESRSS